MTDIETSLSRLWKDGKAAVNGWISIPSVLSAEVMAQAGWDSITIDMQHGAADYTEMLAMLPVIQQKGLTAMVRVPWNDPAQVMRALDAGAMGIICPMIETAEDARRFVSYCLYPPAGIRSFGPMRAKLFFGDAYAEQANDAILPIVMIETKQAIDNLDAILAVEGLGGLYIGPADFSSALGHGPGFDRREPEILSEILRVLDSAKARGIPVGIHCMESDYAADMAKRGFAFVTLASDARFLGAGCEEALRQVRSRMS